MTRKLWEQEYTSKSISSSRNSRPSHGMSFLLEQWPHFGTSEVRKALDLGCGTERNARALAEAGFEVYGIDFAHAPLVKFRRSRSAAGINVLQASMTAALPFVDDVFSLVTAFASIENIRENGQLESLSREISRILHPEGLLFLYFLTPKDGFYRSLIDRQDDGRSLTYDPTTGLRQRVYTLPELSALLGTRFRLLISKDFVFEDSRSGAHYDRNMIASLWKQTRDTNSAA